VIGDTEMDFVSFGKGVKKLVVIPGLSDGLMSVKGKALLLSPPYKKFVKKYTVYMFSRKNRMPEGYTIRQMAADQVTVMKQLGIDKACVLGVSQGGMISQYIAIDHPEMVEKLILAVTTPYANTVVQDAVNGWIGMVRKNDHSALMTDTAEKMYSDKYLEKNRKMFPVLARFSRPKDYDRFLKNAYAILGFDAREELGKIKAPTLIIAGEDDKTVGNDAPEEFRNVIVGSEVFVYPGLGHGTFEEAKDFYDRIYEFCER
jgi:pimeloyl-ACP methyl ester carboxylesterase